MCEKGEEMKQKKIYIKKQKKLSQGQQCGDYQRERGVRMVEEGVGRIKDDGRRLDLG